MRKVFVILMIVLLAGAITILADSIVNPDTFIYEQPGPFWSLDPAVEYDFTSSEVVMQLYDELVQYEGTSTINLSPMLSTNVPSVKDGTIIDNGTTYIFHIRPNVYFHNGDLLTPQDVVYSIERTVIIDAASGPAWLLAGPLFPQIDGQYVSSIVQVVAQNLGLKNPLSYTSLSSLSIFATGTKTLLNDKYRQALVDAFNLLAKDFEIKGNDVIIHLPQPYAPFLYILAGPVSNWAVVLDQKWCAERDAWDGAADDWWQYHNPNVNNDPLYDIENGTGPYMIKYITPGREVFLQRFDDYWAGPAKMKYAVIKYVNEFTTSLLELQRGEADAIRVPIQNLSQVQNNPNITVLTGFPMLLVDLMPFQWNITTPNNFIGSGKLDGNGIPPDFFSNIDVRKAFEYLFPYEQYIEQVWHGQALQPNSAIIDGLLGYDPSLPKYHQDLAKATDYFKKAYDGKLWDVGFKFTIIYGAGNTTRQLALQTLSTYARQINPKFQISTLGEINSSFSSDLIGGKLPITSVSWGADYPDPYDFAFACYSSNGFYASFLGKSFSDFAKQNLDSLVDKLVTTLDPVQRAQIAQKLSKLDYENALYIWPDQPEYTWVARKWVKGWYYNAEIAQFGPYFYVLSK
uniref:ABC transporter substrate-binding protein n=1 Tax=Mesoaciditoga lauensis TaxID=1495039 RepID=A0A7V3RDL6_9BACT